MNAKFWILSNKKLRFSSLLRTYHKIKHKLRWSCYCNKHNLSVLTSLEIDSGHLRAWFSFRITPNNRMRDVCSFIWKRVDMISFTSSLDFQTDFKALELSKWGKYWELVKPSTITLFLHNKLWMYFDNIYQLKVSASFLREEEILILGSLWILISSDDGTVTLALKAMKDIVGGPIVMEGNEKHLNKLI